MQQVSEIETSMFDSTNLHSGLYRTRDKTLFLRFNSGSRIYQYDDVPLGVWNALLHADSAGGFFHRHIKDEYRAREITNPRD